MIFANITSMPDPRIEAEFDVPYTDQVPIERRLPSNLPYILERIDGQSIVSSLRTPTRLTFVTPATTSQSTFCPSFDCEDDSPPIDGYNEIPLSYARQSSSQVVCSVEAATSDKGSGFIQIPPRPADSYQTRDGTQDFSSTPTLRNHWGNYDPAFQFHWADWSEWQSQEASRYDGDKLLTRGHLLATTDSMQPPDDFQEAWSATSQKGRGDRDLRSEWESWQSKDEAWPDDHRILARAVALYNWNGVIPNRRTPGFPIKEGCHMAICNIVNEYWYHVHNQDKCEYVPSAFVVIIEFSSDKLKNLFKNHFPKLYNPGAIVRAPPPPPPRPSSWRRMFIPPSHREEPRQLGGTVERPDVPPAPFDIEPHDFERNQHRVVVRTRYEQFEPGHGFAFYVTLIPAPRWRFTAFEFVAELPARRTIVAIDPHKAQEGSQIETARKQTARMTISGDLNSNKATWSAEENTEERLGLKPQLVLSILLPPETLPPKLKCRYTVGLSGTTVSGQNATDRFQNRCEFSLT